MLEYYCQLLQNFLYIFAIHSFMFCVEHQIISSLLLSIEALIRSPKYVNLSTMRFLNEMQYLNRFSHILIMLCSHEHICSKIYFAACFPLILVRCVTNNVIRLCVLWIQFQWIKYINL